MNRRKLLACLGAASVFPKPTWADVQGPSFLSAARAPDGGFHLCGLNEVGSVLFSVPLPDRGHAAAAHPRRAEAIAFARRPGQFAVVVDCWSGQETHRLIPPANRHFYGHGVFSSDGTILFTTENDLETLEGRIGLWDAGNGYTRIGDVPSGGIGPHDVARMPGTEMLVVANGGIATHPDSGRVPLNLATMRSNLAYIDANGTIDQMIELGPEHRLNSIRHLAIRPDGLIGAGMQWNGAEGESPDLVMIHRRGTDPVLLEAQASERRVMQGYVGSIAFLEDGNRIGVTSPRGGVAQVFDIRSQRLHSETAIRDACGIGRAQSGVTLATSGTGSVNRYHQGQFHEVTATQWAWDNHLVPV